MKTVQTALVAVGFAAQLVSATWNANASPFKTPANCNNTCSSVQQGGFDWNTHPAGNPSSIGDFSFHGCSVKSAAGKRDVLGRRTNGNCIAGHADNKGGPGMQCSSHGFSVHEVHVSTENDKQPIECHYHMPDNSICKTSHTCGKDVTPIKNEQCGGATSMSIAIPTHAPKPSCTVSIHSVNFHCGTASYTPTVTPHSETKTSSSSSSKTTHSEAKTTHSESKTTSASHTTLSTTHKYETKPTTKTETPKNSTSASSYSHSSSSASSHSSHSVPLTTAPASYSHGTAASSYSHGTAAPSNSSSTVGHFTNSSSVASHTTYMHTTTTSCSSGQVITSTAESATQVTITGTKTDTITSCAQTVTDCPARKTPQTSVSTYTTVSSCSKGQEIHTTLTAPSVITTTYQTSKPASPESTPAVVSSPAVSSPAPGTVTAPSATTVTTTCPSGYVVTPSGSGKPTTLTAPSVSSYVVTPSAGTPQQGTSPAQPTEQAAAPNVLPRCLNSFESQCKSNTDSDCYCKDPSFITNAIQCAASHAESDEDAAHAIAYLQGICAPHVASNPAIVTACPSYITPAAPAPTSQAGSAPMTTVPYSSGTYSTTFTAPQVAFATTGSAPGLYPASPASATPAPAGPVAPYPTGDASYGAAAPSAASTGFVSYGTAAPSATAPIASYNPSNSAGKTAVSGLFAVVGGAIAVMLI